MLWKLKKSGCKSTGMAPFRVVLWKECLLPVESWRVLEWERIAKAANLCAELLALRTRQQEQQPEDLKSPAESQCKY